MKVETERDGEHWKLVIDGETVIPGETWTIVDGVAWMLRTKEKTGSWPQGSSGELQEVAEAIYRKRWGVKS